MIHKHLSWAGDMEGFEYCAGKPSGPVPWRCLCLNRVAAEPFTPATGLNDFHSLLSSEVLASNAFALLSDEVWRARSVSRKMLSAAPNIDR